MEFLDKITSIVPNEAQKQIQEMGFYAFLHFGLNTFTGKEWGDGKVPLSEFKLKNADTDQWCEAIKSAGMKGAIITAKHHDGFCLWDTKTTDYSIMNTTYQRDLVKQLQISCEKFGLKLGVYLSPWDRNCEVYSSDKYNDFFMAQIRELLTNYGDIFCIWFDGACGSYKDGKSAQVYEYEKYYELIRELQPKCAISNCGPDVRWVGNEDGLARKSEYNVVPYETMNLDSIAEESQQTDETPFVKVSVCDQDLGSREVLKNHNKYRWYPAEVDVSIRPGWFYHKNQDKQIKYTNKLLHIYLNSVGSNCMLLLNVPPDTNGKISQSDVIALNKLGNRLNSMFKDEIKIANARSNLRVANLENCYVKDVSLSTKSITLEFEKSTIDKVKLIENLDFSQRIEEFTISTKIQNKEKVLFKGTVVGSMKIAMFDWVTTDNITLTIVKSRKEPHIKSINVYVTDYKKIKLRFYEPILNFFKGIGTKIWIYNNNRQAKKITQN